MAQRIVLLVALLSIVCNTALCQNKIKLAFKHSGEDRVGILLVYELKKVLRESGRFELVDEGDADFMFLMNSINPLRRELKLGEATVYSEVLVMKTPTKNLYYFVNAVVGCTNEADESTAAILIADSLEKLIDSIVTVGNNGEWGTGAGAAMGFILGGGAGIISGFPTGLIIGHSYNYEFPRTEQSDSLQNAK